MIGNTFGLSQDEVRLRLKEHGPNEIKGTRKTHPLQIFLRQTKKNLILYLLLFASLISFVVGETVTAVTIVLVAAMVVTVSFIQEYRAEKAIQALKQMVVPISTAIRGRRENSRRLFVDRRE